MIAIDEVVELKIDSIALEGKAIAKIDGYVIFVSGGVPGDIVKAKVFKRKRDYAEAKVVEIVKPSSFRAVPRCRYFGICGGCKWQNLDYEEQIRFKRQQVIDVFERIGGLEIEVAKTIGAGEVYEYRNKLELTFSDNPFRILEHDTGEVALGFHSPGRYDKTIDVEHCHLADKNVNDVINWFRDAIAPDSKLRRELGLTIYNSEKHSGLLRFLTVRKSFATEELMVSLTVLEENGIIDGLASRLHDELRFVSTFASIVNSTRAQIASGRIWKTHFGSGYITDKIGNYSFRISPLSFFQTNTRQAEELYKVVKTNLNENMRIIFDLYSGTGSISLYLSALAEEICGFELVESAVRDANENADLNGVRNVKFIQTDLLDLFKGRDILENFSRQSLPMPGIIVLDPPRSGLHPKIAANIHLLGAKKIIYVSCNPATQARDAKEIVSKGYKPVRSQPVDMFPQTHHIENVLTLQKA
ncbi:MAG TPA: 23S rRNA (uracil(1939)-C(5))-methyltransferase RlmD [Candidatus Acidoferrales bacterium]|nr:23S rRNA (uracil(1939)-C(5))-methyltransferase RlmD [Candidatus Acidoferrales bacterium]